MAQYGISKEGVEALRTLASDMSSLNNDIEENGKNLQSVVGGLSDGLGIFEEEIMDVIQQINSTQEQGRESVEILVNKVNEMADNIESIIGGGL